MEGVRLRPERDDDHEFLFGLYASTREEELAVVPWTAEQKTAFLRQQFEAQRSHYRRHFSDSTFDVVEVDGLAAGRLYVARWPREIRVVDIALMPAHRGRGLGTALMEQVLAEARETGRTVTIHVERFNRALRWYERLGFHRVDETGVYLKMEWRDGPPAAEAAGSTGVRPARGAEDQTA